MTQTNVPTRSTVVPWLRVPPRHSVRLRLALWHTATLAILLIGFSGSAYMFFGRILSQQIDRELLESVQAMESGWRREQRDNGSSVRVAAEEEVTEVRSRTQRALFLDDQERLLAISDTIPLVAGMTVRSLFAPGVWSIAHIVSPATNGKPQVATIGDDDTPVRAVAMSAMVDGRRYVVVMLRDVTVQDNARETFGAWLFAAIPVALFFAGIGGYVLARASLAPVAALSEQAARISASNISERLLSANSADELGVLTSVLNALLLRLDSEFGQQRQFMADASHELRTPVTVIRSAADVALDREDTPVRELRRALGIVNNEGRRMTRIVDDLFLLARADAGQQPIRISPFFLEELIASVGVSGQLLGRARGVTVSAPPADEAPIIGDESLIGRLLLNLVHNAIDHTPSGGTVCLRMDKRNGCALPDGTTRPGDWYRILVEDNGHGVDPNVLERLFERFVRSSPPHLETGDIVSDGAGLGLAIARWIAVAHDGHVVLQSTGPSGSCFAVWLHVAPGVTSL